RARTHRSVRRLPGAGGPPRRGSGRAAREPAMTAARGALRLARRLAAAGARLEPRAGGHVLVQPGSAARPSVEAGDVKALLAAGGIEPDASGALVLSGPGRTMLRRVLAGGEDFSGQNQARGLRMIEHEGERVAVT